MASEDEQQTAAPSGWFGLRWRLIAGAAAVVLLVILALIVFRPFVERPPADLWQAATTQFDPDCGDACRVVLDERPTGHGGSGDASMVMLTDPRLDDAIAQWGDCLDSVISCLDPEAPGQSGPSASQLRQCVANSSCPAACRDRFAERSAGDLEAAAAAFETLFLVEDAWCAPRD
tara:strand:+ start:1115 stop:1639 length:525 start_codon:yes stop_codon:yes gene_type:complete